MTQVEPTTAEPVEGAPVEPAEPEFSLPENFAETVKGWDVPVDQLDEAITFYKSLSTEDGVVDAFIRTGQSLGFGVKELERLFADEQPAPAPVAPAPVAAPAEDSDRLLTLAEARDLLRSEVLMPLEDQRRQEQERSFEQRRTTLFSSIDKFFDDKGITDRETRNFIAQQGEQFIVPGVDSYDPNIALAALERGYAAYEAWADNQHKTYLARKGEQAGALPTPIDGGTHGGEGDDTPDYYALGGKALVTAKDRVRARLRAAGELS